MQPNLHDATARLALLPITGFLKTAEVLQKLGKPLPCTRLHLKHNSELLFYLAPSPSGAQNSVTHK